jgi:hypothetical protein
MHRKIENVKAWCSSVSSRASRAFISIWTNKISILVRAYVVKHKASTCVVLGALVIVFICLGLIYSIYTIDKPRTNIDIVTNFSKSSSLTLKKVIVNLLYHPSDKDRVEITLDFDRDRPSSNPNLLITVPERLILVNHSFNVERTWTYLPGMYYFQIKPEDSYQFSTAFEGNIFGKNIQELNLDFSVIINSVFSSINDIPYTIYIQGLVDTNIGSIYPKPTAQYPSQIRYEYKPGSLESLNAISMSALNKNMVYKTQFYLFALGTIVSLCASVLVDSLMKMIEHIEENRVLSSGDGDS